MSILSIPSLLRTFGTLKAQSSKNKVLETY